LARRRGRPAAAGLLAVATIAAASLAVACGPLLTTCSSPGDHTLALSRGPLILGEAYAADLDGDGTPETILVGEADGRLTISDGQTVYRSREEWLVFEAWLGDTDHNGLPEVVTLLDADDGRHLGLFAYFGGDYREQLVTREIIPAPLALQITTASVGDVIVLTQPPAAGKTELRRTLLRWNGFTFTSVEATVAP
jgi:hypothetical protein